MSHLQERPVPLKDAILPYLVCNYVLFITSMCHRKGIKIVLVSFSCFVSSHGSRQQ